MLIWHADRFFRLGPLCAVATFFVPAAAAVPVAAASDIENILPLLLVSALVMFVGSVVGSVATTGGGILLFSFGSFLAEVSTALLGLVGIALFVTLVLHDLTGAFHRAPRSSARVWKSAAVTVAAVCISAAVAATVAHLVATAATWRAIVVPFGVAAVGFAIKLAADSHAKAALQLTKKRAPTEES